MKPGRLEFCHKSASRHRFALFFFALTQIAILPAAVSPTAYADNIVDPSKVAPEHREAAERRRAEQLKLMECAKAAREAKLPPRDYSQYMSECFDKPDAPSKAANKPD